MINIGILGYGFMGHIHLTRLTEMEQYHVAAVCDIDEEKLQDVPEGIGKYSDIDAFFAAEDIDTVIIATPNHLHLKHVTKAAKAGKRIICEKPAAMSVSEFDEMMEVVSKYGVPFTVHQQRRWDPDFRTAKKVYDSQELGQAYTIQSKLFGYNGNMHDWHVYKEFGGGMLYDWGVHLIDQMLWMVDSEIETLFADVRNVINEEVDDYFKIMIRFKNGVSGEIELGTYFLADRDKWFQKHWFIGGNKGSMYIDGFAPEGKIVKTTRLLTNVKGKQTMTAAGPTRSFGTPPEGVIVTSPLPEVDTKQSMFFTNYYNAINGKEDFIVTPAQVRRVLRFMELARKSAETGESVRMDSGN